MKDENIYRISRENFNNKDESYYSREKAAEKLHISVASLARYETNESEPNPEVVYNMSQVFKDPNLRRKYCSTCCMIGKEDHPYSIPKTLFESGYGLINANRVLETFKNELFEVLADGIVDKDEITKLKELLPQLKDVRNLINDIEIEIEKHSLHHKGNRK